MHACGEPRQQRGVMRVLLQLKITVLVLPRFLSVAEISVAKKRINGTKNSEKLVVVE